MRVAVAKQRGVVKGGWLGIGFGTGGFTGYGGGLGELFRFLTLLKGFVKAFLSDLLPTSY